VTKSAEVVAFQVFQGLGEETRQVVETLWAALCKADEKIFEDHLILVLGYLAAQFFSLNRRS